MQTKSDNRSVVIDALRGYFIIWIGLYNTFAIFNAIKPSLELSAILLFINDKGWFCLSAIFGYGFGMLIKKDNQHNFFPKRMLMLLLLGFFNNLFFYGDILKEYAVIGLILFYTRHVFAKHPLLFLLLTSIFTLTTLYFTPFDMQKAGTITAIVQHNNLLIANLKYCFYLNTLSLYYALCFHTEIFFLAILGYAIATLNIEKKIVLNRKKLLFGGISMIFLTLYLALFTIESNTPIFKILFFLYILSLSTSFVIGFYSVIKKCTSLANFLIVFGRRSLTIYLLQNMIICTVWLWNESLFKQQYSLFFIGYCTVQLLVLYLSRFGVVNKIGIIEVYWRKWSQKL